MLRREFTIGATHPEWPRMWESLFDVVGSYTDRNPEAHEGWQYTGTFWKDRPSIGSTLPSSVLVHQFRHRARLPTAKPIAVAGGGYGRVVIEITTSQQHSGNWNQPIPEGTLM